MGVSQILCVCDDCDEEFYITIEWKSQEELVEYIKNKECPECGKQNWQTTDNYER